MAGAEIPPRHPCGPAGLKLVGLHPQRRQPGPAARRIPQRDSARMKETALRLTLRENRRLPRLVLRHLLLGVLLALAAECVLLLRDVYHLRTPPNRLRSETQVQRALNTHPAAPRPPSQLALPRCRSATSLTTATRTWHARPVERKSPIALCDSGGGARGGARGGLGGGGGGPWTPVVELIHKALLRQRRAAAGDFSLKNESKIQRRAC